MNFFEYWKDLKAHFKLLHKPQTHRDQKYKSPNNFFPCTIKVFLFITSQKIAIYEKPVQTFLCFFFITVSLYWLNRFSSMQISTSRTFFSLRLFFDLAQSARWLAYFYLWLIFWSFCLKNKVQIEVYATNKNFQKLIL